MRDDAKFYYYILEVEPFLPGFCTMIEQNRMYDGRREMYILVFLCKVYKFNVYVHAYYTVY